MVWDGGRALKEYLIIDGYNVINGWPMLRDLAIESFEESRRQLIEMMVEYQSFKGIHVIIVFDAHLVKGSIEKKDMIKGVKIVFTKESQTADSYIEKLILQLSKKHRVTVVTNDWAEQQMVLGGGAIRMTIREFIIDFNGAKSSISKKTEKLQEQREALSNRIDPIVLEKLEKLRRKS